LDLSTVIVSVSRLTTPPLVPELELRLVTSESLWWRMTPEQLEAQGVPEPFWAFAWPGGQALARYILDHPSLVEGKAVVDFGAGGGLISLAARRAKARSIVATEVDPWALVAYRMNVPGGEIFNDDWIGRPLPKGSVLLCGDMSYSAELSRKLLAWFEKLEDVTIVIGDASRGFIAQDRFETLAEYAAPADYDDEGRYRIKASVLLWRSCSGVNDRL
jgi:predicted nicotinamide N-methyase